MEFVVCECWEEIPLEWRDIITWWINCTACGNFSEDSLLEEPRELWVTKETWMRTDEILSTRDKSLSYELWEITVSDKIMTLDINISWAATKIEISYHIKSRTGFSRDDAPVIEEITIHFDQVTQEKLKIYLIKLEKTEKRLSDSIKKYFYQDYD